MRTTYEEMMIMIDKLMTQSTDAEQANYDEALAFSMEALRLVQTIDAKAKECFIYHTIARIYYFKGQFKLALNYAEKALDLVNFVSEDYLKYKIYNGIGVYHYSLGEYVKALSSFFSALAEIKEEEAVYKKDVAGLYLNIANIFYQNQDYEHCLDALGDALKWMVEIDSEHGCYLCYNTYGNTYIEMGDVEQAAFYFNKCLELAVKMKAPQYLASIYNNLSTIAEKKGELRKAIELVEKSLEINKELNREAVIAIDYRRVGIISCEEGEVEKGIDYLGKSLVLSIKLADNSETLITLKALAERCAAAQKWEMAYEYRTQLSELHKETFNAEKSKLLSEMQVRHQLERKKREAELLKTSEERIRLYADKLEESNKNLERFAHVASHDMREPLRMIHSFLKLINEKVKAYNDKDLNEYLGYAIEGANRMDVLIKEVLNLASVQAQEIKMEAVDLNDVLLLSLHNLKTTISESNATITYGVLPVLTGNLSLLTQLFQNLIGNGIKYNKSKQPAINIRVNETEVDYHIEVMDNGIGIPEDDQSRVFEMMTRLNTRTEFEGTGIGLATCKTIVERHNGKIWVTSEVGIGSNFQFFLQK